MKLKAHLLKDWMCNIALSSIAINNSGAWPSMVAFKINSLFLFYFFQIPAVQAACHNLKAIFVLWHSEQFNFHLYSAQFVLVIKYTHKHFLSLSLSFSHTHSPVRALYFKKVWSRLQKAQQRPPQSKITRLPQGQQHRLHGLSVKRCSGIARN